MTNDEDSKNQRGAWHLAFIGALRGVQAVWETLLYILAFQSACASASVIPTEHIH